MHGEVLTGDAESALYHHFELNYTAPNTKDGWSEDDFGLPADGGCTFGDEQPTRVWASPT